MSETGGAGPHGTTLFSAAGLYLVSGIGIWISAILYRALPSVFSGDGTGLLAAIYYYAPFMLIPMLGYVACMPERVSGFRFRPFRLRWLVFALCLAWWCADLANLLNFLWLPLLQKLGVEVFGSGTGPGNASELMRCVLGAALLAPICEELLFRGVLLSAWEGRGVRRAIWATAFLFALAQGSPVPFAEALLIGAVSASLVLKARSAYPAIVFRCTLTAKQLFDSYGVTVPEEEAAAMRNDLAGYLGRNAVLSAALAAAVLSVLLFLLMRVRTREEGSGKPGRMSSGTALMLLSGTVTFAVFSILNVLIV